MAHPSHGPSRRRGRIAALAAGAALLLAGTAAGAASRLVYFGTHGNAIVAARIDDRTGKLSPIGTAAEVERPTWLIPATDRPVLYAVSETGNDGKSQASVYALDIDRASGKLVVKSKVQSGGGGATHLDFDPRSHTVFVANFGTGTVAALPVTPDGGLAAAASTQTDVGSGPHPRQKSPHAHGVTIDPSGRYLLVPDLGADRVFVYAFDPATRTLSPGPTPFYQAPPGSGPRHAVFLPGTPYLYVNSELTGQITAFAWDARAGTMRPLRTISTFPDGYAGERSSAEIVVSRDGRFLYASNRNEDTVVAYAVDRGTGLLREIQRLPSGGKLPWSMALDPAGRWLVVANEAANLVTVLGVDRRTGMLTDTGQKLPVATPVSVAFPTR